MLEQMETLFTDEALDGELEAAVDDLERRLGGESA
jgi:hypothetical protein